MEADRRCKAVRRIRNTPGVPGPTTTGVGATVVPNIRGNTGTHVNVSWTGDSAIAVEVVCH